VALPDLVSRVAARHAGIVVLTAEATETTTVFLIQLGADDVIVRPYSAAELRARLHAILRRRAPRPKTYAEPAAAGPIRLDVDNRQSSVAGEPLNLSPLEFAVLLALQARDGAPVSRGVLLDECWPSRAARRPEYVDAVIRRLRLRVELDPSHPQRLLTIRSKGYALRR
jgi:DNA-binding response OmpR family regulator